jgi:toxin ParE1/3/4
MTAVLSPRARRDLLEAVNWIAKDNKAAAAALRTAVVEAVKRIGDHPQIGVVRVELADEPIRFLTLTGFPYIVVYDAGATPPLILCVLHGARDLPDVLRDL